MKILVATNTFRKYLRQNIAMDSLRYLKVIHPEVDLIDIQFVDEVNTFEPYDGIKSVPLLETHSMEEGCGGDKKLPVMCDLLFKIGNYAITEGYDYWMFVNSDIIVMPSLIEDIKSRKHNTVACSRMDIAPIDSFERIKEQKITVVRWEPAGFDGFCFNTEWFNDHMEDMCEGTMFLGMPEYDVLLAGRMAIYDPTFKMENSYPPKLFHIQHESTWVNKNPPEKIWNQEQIKNNKFDKLVCNMMYFNLQYNLCRRQPFGSFLKIPPDEQQKTYNYFQAMNLSVENRIKIV